MEFYSHLYEQCEWILKYKKYILYDSVYVILGWDKLEHN